MVAILLFPIGLLALLAEKREEQIMVFFRDEGNNATEITVSGGVRQGRSNEQLHGRLNEFDPATRGSMTEEAPFESS